MPIDTPVQKMTGFGGVAAGSQIKSKQLNPADTTLPRP
jgi:hypothetical protein